MKGAEETSQIRQSRDGAASATISYLLSGGQPVMAASSRPESLIFWEGRVSWVAPAKSLGVRWKGLGTSALGRSSSCSEF
ncbi:hypothetical protein GDO78_003308 [Eleutherodactylus coqui]|uniref:Uncharacterized protein n=1 Tax=Eleutherodactylus coqui TaxID=57060 RepID=A0A8J6ETC4_ELECQ|nr:hypothetical protein GDO78_003308 [Eleutherodactylus coqui]